MFRNGERDRSRKKERKSQQSLKHSYKSYPNRNIENTQGEGYQYLSDLYPSHPGLFQMHHQEPEVGERKMQNLDKQSSVVGAKYKPAYPESSTKPKQGGHKKQLMSLKFFKWQNITNRQIDRKQLCLFVVVGNTTGLYV